jgi:predicted TIM-barrel fold metal-dependent hydrolase
MADFELVDAHQHIGDLSAVLPKGAVPETPALSFEEDLARRIKAMDSAGISWAVLQPNQGYLKPDGLRDTMRLNDEMARYKRHSPARFRAVFGTVEPTYGERGLAEINRCKNELGLDGMSWHHRFQGCYIDTKWMWPFLERMAELDMAAIIHVNAESSLEAAWRLQRLATDFPMIRFLAFDGLWSFERAGEVSFRASQTPNVIWDIGGPANYLNIAEWIDRHGAETVCYSMHGGVQIQQQLERAAISNAERALILGGNIKRMFSID